MFKWLKSSRGLHTQNFFFNVFKCFPFLSLSKHFSYDNDVAAAAADDDDKHF
jgi:hypothetical protein